MAHLKLFQCKSFLMLPLFLLLPFSCKEQEDPNLIKASGNFEATEVTVSSKTAGEIISFGVQEGDDVKSGDVLAVLDHSLLDVQLRQAEAGVQQAESQLQLLQSGARKEDIRIAQEQVDLARISLQQAKDDKDRFEQLIATNTITRKQYDDAVAKHDMAANQLNTALENLKKVKSIIRPEEIGSAKANLKKSQAAADLIRKNIEDCTILSPVAGTITRKFAEAGEYVTPGSSLLNIADLSSVDLKIYIPEQHLGKIKTGDSVEVTTDSFNDRKYTGKIIYISSQAEFTPKNIQTEEERTKLVYAVKVRIQNPERELKSGMPADAIIRVK